MGETPRRSHRLRIVFHTGVFYVVFAAGGILFTLLFFLPLTILIRLVPAARRIAWWIAMMFFRVLSAALALSGSMRLAEVRNRERLLQRSPAIFVANHRSLMDVLLLLSVVPRASCLLMATRKPVEPTTHRRSFMPDFWRPFIMAPFSLLDYVPMPPSWSDAGALMRAFERCTESLRAGRPLVIFPEGTRSATGALLPFQDFPFKLAVKTGVPVVPIAIHSDVAFMPKGSIIIDVPRRAVFRIVVLPPIPAREGARTADLSGEARSVIRLEVAELDRLYGFEREQSGPPGIHESAH